VRSLPVRQNVDAFRGLRMALPPAVMLHTLTTTMPFTARFAREALPPLATPRAPWHWIALAAVLSLSGCGTEAKQSTGDAPAAIASSVVRVAAASDLKFALSDVIAAFERDVPTIHIEPTFGASGVLFEQLTNHAPFDVFLSADIAYPRKLIEQKLASADTEFLYAYGELVLWTSKSSGIDVEKLGIQAVTDPKVRKIAIANPKTAPYGRAAEAALKSLGVYDTIQDRLVEGGNIAETAQYVESGVADVGLIALSLAVAPAMRDKGVFWIVPADAFPRLEQGGVILSDAKDRAAAEKFRAFLISAAGRQILTNFGFNLPGA
jgi:molybdate transport system substrate-binding protein